jgi:hypothetical protein
MAKIGDRETRAKTAADVRLMEGPEKTESHIPAAGPLSNLRCTQSPLSRWHDSRTWVAAQTYRLTPCPILRVTVINGMYWRGEQLA